MTATDEGSRVRRAVAALVVTAGIVLGATGALGAAGGDREGSAGSPSAGGLVSETDSAGATEPAVTQAPVPSGSSGVAVGRASFPDVAVSSAAPSMAWFPGPSGPVPGVTATGQANVPGDGADARDEAIRRAVQDARRQAEVAVTAAGGALGAVLDIQVSASPVAVPVGAEGRSVPGFPGSAGGGTTGQSDPGCPPNTDCEQPIPVETWVSVTVTWEIA